MGCLALELSGSLVELGLSVGISQSVLWRPLALFAADRCMCFLQPRAETTGEGRKRRTRMGH